ncbi:Uncharacterized protein FKW44_007287 [Caligus rogercresseyi]|uniref:Uncharacterized protein n=1 Tax=Caligus rogercresseyi TaxID=217165 RepID=A0A7T8KEJ4_CALRO|nr:Uncharacterized protein FKW44_007287 [Caligus rogercresseyi]
MAEFFEMEDKMTFCSDINGLSKELGCDHDLADWRLFIDSGKNTLKAVVLHKGNEKPSVPLAHAFGMTVTYETMQQLLDSMKYNDFKCHICGDLKVVVLLLGLQSGYTKYMCFLCLWDSRDDKNHWTKKDWKERKEHEKFGNTLSEAKIKAGVFVGPQIRQIMKDETFPTTLNPKELAA